MLPFLTAMSDRNVRRVNDVGKLISAQFGMTEAELAQRIPSGQSTIFENRIGWARTYLKKAGLIEPVLRGQYRITQRGLGVLDQHPPRIDVALLRQFPEFIEFLSPRED